MNRHDIPRVASWRKIIGGIGIAISLLLCFGFVGGYERNLISSWPLWLSGAGLLFSAWFGGYLEEEE